MVKIVNSILCEFSNTEKILAKKKTCGFLDFKTKLLKYRFVMIKGENEDIR